MTSQPSAESKDLDETSDPDNDRVDRALAHIKNLKAFDGDELSKLLARGEGRYKLPFKVSRKEFDEWRSEKEEEIEEIGGFEYDSSLENIIIKADGGPLHEGTVGALFHWLRSLASEHTEFRVSLGEGNFASHYFHMIINIAAEFNFMDSAGKITDTKRPDCFIENDQKSYPRIVVEVGYSETFNKLIEDAHRWLLGSNLVHRVFLVKIDKKDEYQLFKETVESNKRDETPGKPNRWTDYINLLDGANEDFSNTSYSGRRSRVYDLPTEQLQRYFEERTNNIEELQENLKAWHARKFPLLEIKSVTFYVYGWSVSENGDPEIGEIGREVYYPADSSTTSSLKITMDDLFGDDKTAIEDNIVSVGDKTSAVPLPTKDLRAQIDKGIKKHITNTIRKLVGDLRTEYLHWKQPPSYNNRCSRGGPNCYEVPTPYSLRNTIRRTFKSRDSSKSQANSMSLDSDSQRPHTNLMTRRRRRKRSETYQMETSGTDGTDEKRPVKRFMKSVKRIVSGGIIKVLAKVITCILFILCKSINQAAYPLHVGQLSIIY